MISPPPASSYMGWCCFCIYAKEKHSALAQRHSHLLSFSPTENACCTFLKLFCLQMSRFGTEKELVSSEKQTRSASLQWRLQFISPLKDRNSVLSPPCKHLEIESGSSCQGSGKPRRSHPASEGGTLLSCAVPLRRPAESRAQLLLLFSLQLGALLAWG